MSDDWKRGLRMLERGLYVSDEGAFHIDAKEFLEAAGVVPVPRLDEDTNRMLQDLAHVIAREMGAVLHEEE